MHAIKIKRATPKDAFLIAELYNKIYRGVYPDPVMASPDNIAQTLVNQEFYWIVGVHQGQVIGSLVYRYDSINALAKVYGAVVHESYRGHDLTEKLMRYGFEALKKANPPIQVVYTMTRTVSPAPQKLTANLGFKKAGIFPNVHKTDLFETHGLAVLLSDKAIQSREKNFELHPKLSGLFELTRNEFELPPLKLAKAKKNNIKRKAHKNPLEFEVIYAEKFVRHRFHEEKKAESQQNWFFPFHEPNLLLTTPDQKVEVYCYLSSRDKHCVIIGIRDVGSQGLRRILDSAIWSLHEIGARYVELLSRADDIKIIDTVMTAEFIPCAYFPAMYLDGKKRYDFVVFSRSFEILNFKNIKLDGVNRQYLLQYFNLWKETSIGL